MSSIKALSGANPNKGLIVSLNTLIPAKITIKETIVPIIPSTGKSVGVDYNIMISAFKINYFIYRNMYFLSPGFKIKQMLFRFKMMNQFFYQFDY